MISVIANGVYYRSLVAFCKQNHICYPSAKQKLEESFNGVFFMKGFKIKVATQKDIDKIENGDSVETKEAIEVKVCEPVPEKIYPKGMRPPLLTRLETCGIGTNWRG